MQLSKNFTLAEFSRSGIATALKLDNTVPSKYVNNLKALCEQVLQPARDRLGVGMRITSGFRSPIVNQKAGGTSSSQHLVGESCDIVTTDGSNATLMRLFLILMDGAFDQLIWENDNGKYWIHVSYRADPTKNRQKVLFLTVEHKKK